jgi:hypothetical protein
VRDLVSFLRYERIDRSGTPSPMIAEGPRTNAPRPAGRDDVIECAAVALDRLRAGRAARSVISSTDLT